MKKTTADRIIDRLMSDDPFSHWLEIVRVEEAEGYCKLQMYVSEQMCNGLRVAHGGITYSLADTAMAFAANSRGRKAVSMETSISHLKPVLAGEAIIAVTEEISMGDRIGVYIVKVTNGMGLLVALFKGTVYRTNEIWDF